MKRVITLILVLVLASMANGDQKLTVNGEDVDSITIKLGQSCTVEVDSNDHNGYLDNIGFDDCNGLGDFYHLETTPEAGSSAEVNPIDQPDFCGYEIITYYPWTGVHFIFQYDALQIGETILKLYGHPLQSKIEKDSLRIKVIPPDIGTAFTYQGWLRDSSVPSCGYYDFEFKLFDSPDVVLGEQLGCTIATNERDVEDGIFTEKLDFAEGDPNVFNGDSRWLGIAVRPGDSNDPNDFVTLSPRQEVTPTPYAIHADNGVPKGGIIMWSGSLSDIPSGWALCNGSNGTPDLRNRFIIAAGGSYGVGSTGGSTQHNHGGNTGNHTLTIAEMPAHSHRYESVQNLNSKDCGNNDEWGFQRWNTKRDTTTVGGNQPHSHGISNANHLPPYYALAYIMKL